MWSDWLKGVPSVLEACGYVGALVTYLCERCPAEVSLLFKLTVNNLSK